VLFRSEIALRQRIHALELKLLTLAGNVEEDELPEIGLSSAALAEASVDRPKGILRLEEEAHPGDGA
jgi:hypothetical protein